MKIQWPGFDAKTVAEIEEYLGMTECTEIVYRSVDSANPEIQREIEESGVYKFRAAGAVRKRYCRPMIELFDDGATSAAGGRGRVRESCPECDDWSRTAVCVVHPELSLDEIRWHREQDRRWPDIYQGPALESGAVGRAEPRRQFRGTLDEYIRELADAQARANRFAFGFEVSRPGEWAIDVA